MERFKTSNFTFKRTGEKLIFGRTGPFEDVILDKDFDVGEEIFIYQVRSFEFSHFQSGAFILNSHGVNPPNVGVAIGSRSVFKMIKS